MLYKYLPCDRVDVLENLKIRFTQLRSLNDPFEALPLIDASLQNAEISSLIERDMEKVWSCAEPHEKTVANRTILESVKKELLQNSNEILSPHSLGARISQRLSLLGVLSLSRTESSLLMWSHYASEGKGFVLAFDDNHTFFHQPDKHGDFTKPIPVIYSGKRRKVAPEDENLYQKVLCEKPLEWAYEEEERVFRSSFSNAGSVGKDEYDEDIILYDLPLETIKGIYIGYRASQDTITKIFSAIKRNCIDCPVFDSSICTDEYKVKFSASLRGLGQHS